MIKLEDKPNAEAPSVAYPYGNIKDNNGTGNGTPVNKIVYADFHQFFAKMFAESGLVSNELPDNETNGFQYFEALVKLYTDAINLSVTGTDDTIFIEDDGITSANNQFIGNIFCNGIKKGKKVSIQGILKVTFSDAADFNANLSPEDIYFDFTTDWLPSGTVYAGLGSGTKVQGYTITAQVMTDGTTKLRFRLTATGPVVDAENLDIPFTATYLTA